MQEIEGTIETMIKQTNVTVFFLIEDKDFISLTLETSPQKKKVRFLNVGLMYQFKNWFSVWT